MAYEDFPTQQQGKAIEREKAREKLFLQLVASKILDSFLEDFKDALYDNGMVKNEELERASAGFLSTFSDLSEDEKTAALAVPFELRTTMFKKYAMDVVEGEIRIDDLPKLLLERGKKMGNTIGYHLSPLDISEPKESNQGQKWTVKGTGSHAWPKITTENTEIVNQSEKGMEGSPFAFYSRDYTSRYIKKPMRYLYVVVGKTKEGEGHFLSNQEKWGHAPTLDVIQKIDMLELEQELSQRLKILESKTTET